MEPQPGSDPRADRQDGRHIELVGAHNFRDIGGYQTTDGRQVRRGVLYRSARLNELTDDDHDTLMRLGIGAVYDLRSPEEAAREPSRLPAGLHVEARTTPARAGSPGETLVGMIVNDTLPEGDDDDYVETYTRQLDADLTAEFRRVLELALGAAERPLVFHCAAGKDRTGLATAIALGTLGVPEETIVDDYGLTNRYLAVPLLAELGPLMEQHGVDRERVEPFLEARTTVFRRSLSHLRERWGTFDTYVTSCLGLDGEFPDRFRAALLVPVES